MAKSNLSLNTKKLEEALKTYSKPHNVAVVSDAKTSSVELVPANKTLLEHLYDTMPLTESQKAKISGFLFGGVDLSTLEVKSLNEFFKKVGFVNDSVEPMFESQIGGHWYPIMVSMTKRQDWSGNMGVVVSLYAQIGALNYNVSFKLTDADFTDRDDKPVKRNVVELLKKNGLRLTTPESLAECKELNKKVFEMKREEGKLYDVSGPGFVYHDWFGWGEVQFGWKDSPAKGIVEPRLENRYGEDDDSVGWHIPLVRVFSMKHKDYLYVAVKDLVRHEYSTGDREKIVLPPSMMGALDGIFAAEKGNIFGDLFTGRHGGIVVLANGPSGVGKTLTAEVFAEFQERPLYVMEMGEIGTTLREVEKNLQKIFARARKWNAVLLFDEADIFLSERVASDLERSAIVGIFLRLLDYYEGTFFLTTNRGEGIDAAFKSRVTLYLNYPKLSAETRVKIWSKMVHSAGIDVTKLNIWEIADVDLNGRQIRNQVRLLKLMYPDGKMTQKQFLDSLEFAAR